jgi:hypothetical protein
LRSFANISLNKVPAAPTQYRQWLNPSSIISEASYRHPPPTPTSFKDSKNLKKRMPVYAPAGHIQVRRLPLCPFIHHRSPGHYVQIQAKVPPEDQLPPMIQLQWYKRSHVQAATEFLPHSVPKDTKEQMSQHELQNHQSANTRNR